jgi:hypothetical protein
MPSQLGARRVVETGAGGGEVLGEMGAGCGFRGIGFELGIGIGIGEAVNSLRTVSDLDTPVSACPGSLP